MPVGRDGTGILADLRSLVRRHPGCRYCNLRWSHIPCAGCTSVTENTFEGPAASAGFGLILVSLLFPLTEIRLVAVQRSPGHFWNSARFPAEALRAAMFGKARESHFSKISINLPLAHSLRNAEEL